MNKNKDIDKVDPNAGITTVQDIRHGLLELAGFTPKELSGLVRKAVKTLEDGLEATNTQTLSYMGQKGDEIVTADNAIRHRSAEALLRFTDSRPKQTETTKDSTHISFTIPTFYTEETAKAPKVVNQ